MHALHTRSHRSSPVTTAGGSASRAHAEPRGQAGPGRPRALEVSSPPLTTATSGQDELWKPDLLTELLIETRGPI